MLFSTSLVALVPLEDTPEGVSQRKVQIVNTKVRVPAHPAQVHDMRAALPKYGLWRAHEPTAPHHRA